MIQEAIDFLQREVRPNANAMDGDPEALRRGLNGLSQHGWMALRRPEEFGGPALNENDFRQFQEEVARASGALAFLQTQHQSAVSMIAKGSNDRLKGRVLPHTHNGERLIGIGFSQLRRPGPPILRAEFTDGGFLITGHIPWITGFGFFHEVLIGAQLPDGRAVFGLIPFSPQDEIQYSGPMKLAAMESAQTVTADLKDWFLAEHEVVDIKPSGWIMRNDMINITLQGFFAVGCARAGIDVVREQAEKRNKEFMRETAIALEEELLTCREKLQAAQAMSEETTEEKLHLRAWAIDLAGRCAHAAVTASGGAANSTDHPAQRILREALVFTVSGQTELIQKATLERFVRK